MAKADFVWAFASEVTDHEGEALADGVGLTFGGDIEPLQPKLDLPSQLPPRITASAGKPTRVATHPA